MHRLLALTICLLAACRPGAQPTIAPDLVFDHLASRWDEAIPLGNGMLGALLWQQAGALRLSLDRADLWDLRPTPDLERFDFQWVVAQVRRGDYGPVQQLGDLPYERDPGPTKIPGAALEFDLAPLGEVESVTLDVIRAVCVVRWRNGATLTTFVHATDPVGWFRFEHLPDGAALGPHLVPPPYVGDTAAGAAAAGSVAGEDLRRLGYPAGRLVNDDFESYYEQPGWGGFRYQVAARWERAPGSLTGVWTIGSHGPELAAVSDARSDLVRPVRAAWSEAHDSHVEWWRQYWSQSAIQLPDTLLQRQWYLEQYKFGAASRRGAPPITLQAVWTADNGRIPPWKGDFHHDLNTELSYWPAYAANHLEEAAAFTDWLWDRRPAFERWTKRYFGTGGLNVPGVTTLAGEPMGGWIQYSLSPTMGAWTAQHFYLQWRYSGDRTFLAERAYPFISAVARHIERLSVTDRGRRRLPLHSSPEFNDNSIDAWFVAPTNFDLALMRWTLAKAAELASELQRPEDATHWRSLLEEFPELDRAADGGLTVAPGYPYRESHRHFSHLLAIHPLGLIDWSGGDADRRTILTSIADLERGGTDWWVGYSFAWLGNLYARARLGDKAAQVLRLFASCFVSPNSFHLNGNQCAERHSNFTYRPFTLEGNFAFAAGVQEMLLQSHATAIEVFPAVPDSWPRVAFTQLRAEGAFLVSAERRGGRTTRVTVRSERGGVLRLVNPFEAEPPQIRSLGGRITPAGIIELEMLPGQEIILRHP